MPNYTIRQRLWVSATVTAPNKAEAIEAFQRLPFQELTMGDFEGDEQVE